MWYRVVRQPWTRGSVAHNGGGVVDGGGDQDDQRMGSRYLFVTLSDSRDPRIGPHVVVLQRVGRGRRHVARRGYGERAFERRPYDDTPLHSGNE